MIAKLKPYPEYKDSGLPWLGEIPNHWENKPGLFIFSEKEVKNTGLIENTVLSLSYGRIVVKPPEKLHGLVPESFETYQIVDPGDIIIRSTDLQNDWNSLRVGLVENRGIITSAYICLNTNHRMIPAYAHLLLHSYDLMKIFYGMGSGLRQNLDWTDFKRLPVLIPPPNEQQKIVDFIKVKNREISRFIRVKQRMIELLKEQKQAIINQAVTKGIDPNVKLKPSGIDYLGDIPGHWEMRRLKLLVNNVNEQTSSKDEDDIYIALEHIESWTGKVTLPSYEVVFESQVKRFRPNDILFGKLRPYLAKVALVKTKGVCVGELLILRNKTKEIVPSFLEQKLRSIDIINLINSSTFGAKMPRADWKFIGNVLIAYPPKIDEQKDIIADIETQSIRLDAAISRAQHEIGLIHEYRTRLISDVVTGKLNVRDISVEQVEDIEESEELEEIQENEELTEPQEVADADN